MRTTEAALSAVLRRDRLIVFAALAIVVGLSWAYVLQLAWEMNSPSAEMPGMSVGEMAAMAAPGFVPWTLAHGVFIFAMWTVMMVGMMTPSVAPMVLTYVQVGRHAAASGRPFASALWFLLGYLGIWTVLSVAATLIQYALERGALLTPMMEGASRLFGGAVLIGIGVFQWTPIKGVCLSQCRAPLAFIQKHGGFAGTATGSLRLGAIHGAYCVGCCWALMALLFVVGVMNTLWIAAITTFVLLEKIIPWGRFLSRLAGAAVAGVGLWMLAR
ncbi:metal-binding protein [Labrys miyagiensis]|uniref:Metal-binding protein n=1 Tax=Labrys miyagiensis TaxID=346912 RepID=A0ABQ6CND8_9HYPH|nr:DUF2182 domain-containing protein [Labrys miyagiensis]GLS20425.1 metal-binding protein [Labrys miyagiensis]